MQQNKSYVGRSVIGRAQATAVGRGQVVPPSPSFPKGGGAIRGLGEKFSANPVTGTGSMTVPIATSPGRSGFGPHLALSYDSGAGNGPFGFGWNLSIPAITRKTDKGVPKYEDSEESDTFVLSGSEDLVPILDSDGTVLDDAATAPGFVIRRYRPRIEGLFARIERWTEATTGETHWRSISRENVISLYGTTDNSRIVDPSDRRFVAPARIFSWLICESYDDKGNAIVYEYVAENGDNVDHSHVNERNRLRIANRYLKRIRYGNRVSRRIQPDLTQASWLFEVVFDYDDGHCEDLDPSSSVSDEHRFVLAAPTPGRSWLVRPDPFSSYRAGFEVRTYRRCRRVLMFHHVPDPPGGGTGYDGLVRSVEFDYADLDDGPPVEPDDELAHQGSTRFASFITRVTESGYVRHDTRPLVVRNGVSYATYLKSSLPPLEFAYSKALIDDELRELDGASVENLPMGVDGPTYQWADLDGEGVPGILTEQAGAWFYKPNLGEGHFGSVYTVIEQPASVALGRGGGHQLLDLAGDGQLDFVVLAGPAPGFYERSDEDGWARFRPFRERPNIAWNDPNLRFIDLDGDGHADVLITEDGAFVCHPSLAEDGFGPAHRVTHSMDEEQGPRLVFADGTQSVHLADMSGDGLTDVVRLRNQEVCYWPNLGHGHFGAKVTMDDAPWFDHPDRFDQGRIRLADIDGSGTTDIIYLGSDGVRLYFNQAGNRWTSARHLRQLPPIDNVSTITTADLLGNGTACLVWSSPLPERAPRPLRYIDLMGHVKPHLLITALNGLGTETRVDYAPSTRFFLADKHSGRPWVTRLPFPVHVVERVATHDRVSGNRLITRYSYHHGYFDGFEREFRGFGMVEQLDTEQFAVLDASGGTPVPTNVESESHVPPILTKTWFHTGIHLGGGRVSDYFAGLLGPDDIGEYYREPGLNDAEARAGLLADTVLPDNMTVDEERAACRALKGAMLRQEIYALDGTAKQSHPYTVTEQNLTVRLLQQQGANRDAVFLTHEREEITYHYERNPADPRVSHRFVLAADEFGNVRSSAAVTYPRRAVEARQPEQARTFVTHTSNAYTNLVDTQDGYRPPLPSEERTYEVHGVVATEDADGRILPFRFEHVLELVAAAGDAPYLEYGQWKTELPATERPRRRLVECVRTLYRSDDLGATLRLGETGVLGLPDQTFKLALTASVVDDLYRRVDGNGDVEQPLLDPDPILRGECGYTSGADLVTAGIFPDDDPTGLWWTPSGLALYSAVPDPEPERFVQDEAFAGAHFFQPVAYRDPFGNVTRVSFDPFDLLPVETRDPLGNRVSALRVTDDGQFVPDVDFRVLQVWGVTDANGNRSEAAYDALGRVVGTALVGKSDDGEGDTLFGFEPNLSPAQLDELFNADDPSAVAPALLGGATSRTVYDVDRWRRTAGSGAEHPVFAATIVRETHASDLAEGVRPVVRVTYAFSDGLGREVQRKVAAEPGPIESGGADVDPRWVGSGWVVFDNKGNPVRQYESFYTASHRFELAVAVGVSPIVFYDPLGRVVATLNPDHTYEKVVFDAWQQTTWDENDNVSIADPAHDPDVGALFARLRPTDYLPTWYSARQSGALGIDEQRAADKAAAHAATPSIDHFDPLGRVFRSTSHNRFTTDGGVIDEFYDTRLIADIEGNQRAAVDHHGRTVTTADVDMLGSVLRVRSADAGETLALLDAGGRTVYSWDSRGHRLRMAYDALRRPTRSYARRGSDAEVVLERTVYGESHPEAGARNLRGRYYQHFDGAGVVTNEQNDFKGNALRTSRVLASTFRTAPDWSALEAMTDAEIITASSLPGLEPETFVTSTTFDAVNRPVSITSADGTVVRPLYNRAGLLERLDVQLRGAVEGGEPVRTPFVTAIDYDAKGQRTRVAYGNGVVTTYDYDATTFRLRRLKTERGAAFPDDCADPQMSCGVQNLSYVYDAAGNVTHVRDGAQQTVFFRNRRVEPTADYTYDALYRLVEAVGREHFGQVGSGVATSSWDDLGRVGLAHPGDGNAMGRYAQRYAYDAVGNLASVSHRGTDPAHPGWTRSYLYGAPSSIEAGESCNRLTQTELNGVPEPYAHDGHGNMTQMPHLRELRWDARDRLELVDRGGGGKVYYAYDANGQRVRKVVERLNGTRAAERLYLGAFEVYREFDGAGEVVTLERDTVHVMDDARRIALVETRTRGDDGAPPQLVRYQFDNHLGTAALELDDHGAVVSYEEYYPFGATSYQAVRSQTETPKRYRFTGKERDEESGLYYHGARYLAPWLGRWTSADPAGLSDGLNVYAYARNNPVNLSDPSGLLSWGKWAGIAAAVVVGTVVTVATAGLAGPVVGAAAAAVIGGIVGGAAGSAVGEITEATVDRRPITAANVGRAALIGGAAGGVFAGAGVAAGAIAKTAVGQSVAKAVATSAAAQLVRSAAARVASSAVGQAAKRATERVATSAVGGGASRVAGALRRVQEISEKGGQALGRRIPGTPAAREAAAERANAEAGARLAGAPEGGGPKSSSKAGTAADVEEALAATNDIPASVARGRVDGVPTSKVVDGPTTTTRTPLLTYADGYNRSFDLAQGGQIAVLGKYPGNVAFVRNTPGTFTLDQPWGWTPNYNAGAVRGMLDGGASTRITSQEFSGTFGLEMKQVYNLQQW